MTLTGLSSQLGAQLNGSKARVVDWQAHLKRWMVQLEKPYTNADGKLVRKLNLLPGNLGPLA